MTAHALAVSASVMQLHPIEGTAQAVSSACTRNMQQQWRTCEAALQKEKKKEQGARNCHRKRKKSTAATGHAECTRLHREQSETGASENA